MKKLAAFTAVFLIFLGVLPSAWGKSALPAPTESFYVADYAQVLSEETERQILAGNDVLEPETGAQVVVVTQEFLDGWDIEDYCIALFNQWGIGSSEKNNGVLLLLVTAEEKYWLMQGKGLEGYLSSGYLGEILEEKLEPWFDAADYDTGVQQTCEELFSSLRSYYGISSDGTAGLQPEDSPNYSPEPQAPQTGFFEKALLFFIVLVVVFVFIAARAVRVPRRRGLFSTRRYYRPIQPPPPPPPVRNPPPPPFMGGGMGMGGMGRPPRVPRPPIGRPPSSRKPPSGGGFGGFGGGFGGFGGGSFRGPSGGGARRSGGGGSSRGGGAGRR